jgi:hypothetical protein
MDRWKPYAQNLKPLLDGLGQELVKPEDIELIEAK